MVPRYLTSRTITLTAFCALALPALGMDYKEAPELAAMVSAGTLPPLAERLPVNPEVITPLESIGTYGGTLRFGLSGPSDQEQISQWTGNQGFVRQDPTTGFTTIIPNVVESFDISEDFTAFTFHLREGMRWSDGTLLTADDVMFNLEDIILNPEYGPTPALYQYEGQNVAVTKVDALTVEFKFAGTQAWFLHELPRGRFLDHILYQKAYCSQFHPKYNPQASANGDWRDVITDKCGDARDTDSRYNNPDRPSLEPWLITSPFDATATQVELRRNPYFWMVDSEGNQLPYADKLIGTVYTDPQALLLGAIAGNIDFGFRNLNTAGNRPVLAENREKGGYELFETTAIGGSPGVFQLNLTHKNPELRALFGEKDFRVALSIGMDRQEIIDTALLGAGQPWQAAPFEDSPMYHERYATQYLDYDVEAANALLDGLGLTERNGDGVRLLASGKPLTFKVEIAPVPPEISEMLEIMALQWAKIGVDMDVAVVERSLMFAHVENNEHDAVMWVDHASWLPGRIPTSLAPLEYDSRWGIAWVNWYKSNGAQGEEPPESVKERYRLYAESKVATTFEARKALYDQMADIAADEFEVFAVTKFVSNYGVKKANLRNVAPSHPDTSQYSPALMLPWSWYVAN